MDMSWRKSSYSTGNGGACIEVGVWRKSTYSTTNGGNCVEVGSAIDGATNSAVTSATSAVTSATSSTAGTAPWRTSTHSSNNGGNCVETATVGAAVAVRDTKDNGTGPVLRFGPRAWADFTATLR